MKSYHISEGIEGLLNLSEEEYGSGWLKKDGRTLTLEEAKTIAREYQKEGFVVVPPCENVDAEGYCQGHAAKRPSRNEVVKGMNACFGEAFEAYLNLEEGGGLPRNPALYAVAQAVKAGMISGELEADRAEKELERLLTLARDALEEVGALARKG